MRMHPFLARLHVPSLFLFVFKRDDFYYHSIISRWTIIPTLTNFRKQQTILSLSSIALTNGWQRTMNHNDKIFIDIYEYRLYVLQCLLQNLSWSNCNRQLIIKPQLNYTRIWTLVGQHKKQTFGKFQIMDSLPSYIIESIWRQMKS